MYGVLKSLCDNCDTLPPSILPSALFASLP